jgi:uncharacterized radical SAM superfamily Fe-S cluster-containing enzyme
VHTGIHIGASPEAVQALQKAIDSVLDSATDEETKRVALRVLHKGLEVNNVTLRNCTVMGSGTGIYVPKK